MSPGGIFAYTGENAETTIIQACSSNQLFYIWGSFSGGDAPAVSASALACNASISAIDVDIFLAGAELAIEDKNPPRPIRSSTREVIPANTSTQLISDVYQNLYSIRSTEGVLLDNFFSLLTTSRYAIPMSTISNRSHEALVTEAIIFQHNIIVAQTLSSTARIGYQQPNSTGEYLGVFD
jgi:hypothetical protein